MVQFSGSGINSENDVYGNVWAEEYDCIPLKKRLKLLLTSKRLSNFADTECDKESERTSIAPVDVVIKKEDYRCDSPVHSPTGFGQEVNDHGLSAGQGHVEVSTRTYVHSVKIKTEIVDDFVDDLDHVVLKDRQRLLLSRKPLTLTKPIQEGNRSLLSDSVVADMRHSLCLEKENIANDTEPSFGGHDADVLKGNDSKFCGSSYSGPFNGIVTGSPCTELQCSASMESCQDNKSDKSRNITGIQESHEECLSKNADTGDESSGGQDLVSGNTHSLLRLALSSSFVNIKAEPMDYKDAHSQDSNASCNLSSKSIIPVKIEMEMLEEYCGDEVDHMLLRDRINLLASGDAPKLDNLSKFECSKKIVPSLLNCRPIASESAKPLRVNRLRKRRKTATDSVETALEEDAPGLLQELIDKGVSVNEIKLYGEAESDEALDDSFCKDCFSELEAVISKLFSQRQPFLKFAPVRCTKGEKASYCLACLISLVEQARYLQFRKWPVEWGWSRDLQSFLFVFERHNRIVLERPEYGYATYFFELVDSVPINWQIKRLVTAMKLTSCSRITLIENKALSVGEDVTEGEARVLMEYGWVPNSGLGTMLNYCDRVVHDRKNEKDSSEWRLKIGKLLMDGYNGGTVVSTDIPKKVMEQSGSQGPQIKLEI